MILTQAQARLVIELVSFAQSEGQLDLEDAQLCVDICEAFPELKAEYEGYALKSFKARLTPEAIERTYSQRLTNLLMTGPTLTEAELAQRLGKSEAWVREHMRK